MTPSEIMTFFSQRKSGDMIWIEFRRAKSNVDYDYYYFEVKIYSIVLKELIIGIDDTQVNYYITFAPIENSSKTIPNIIDCVLNKYIARDYISAGLIT